MIYLYRHWDKDGKLLYVGITNKTTSRLSGHRNSSSWAPAIASITIENYPTRELAIEAEWRAIVAEEPMYNKICRRPRVKKSRGTREKMWQLPLLDKSILFYDIDGNSHDTFRACYEAMMQKHRPEIEREAAELSRDLTN